MLNATVEKQRPARTRMGYSKWATRHRLSAIICKVFCYHSGRVVDTPSHILGRGYKLSSPVLIPQ